MPENSDSVLVHHASKAYFDDLLNAGVEVYQYKGGLLHSKTVTADDDVAMLGSVNMDKRSFAINFEISMFVYTRAFTQDLRAIQQGYINDSVRLELNAWGSRPVHDRAIQNAAQLLAPIL